MCYYRTADGMCKKHSDNVFTAYCVEGPCPDDTPTNADRIRRMSDEELARWLVDATVCERVCDEDEYCHGNECIKRVTGWLQSPAETEGTE